MSAIRVRKIAELTPEANTTMNTDPVSEDEVTARLVIPRVECLVTDRVLRNCAGVILILD